MNISGIRPEVGFYDLNSISKDSSNKKDANASLNQNSTNGKAGAYDNTKLESKAKKSFGAYDYADTYNPSDAYAIRNNENTLRSYDVDKVLSDMRKDQVLQQYQYFVGQQASVSQTDGGANKSVRPVEDFSL